MHAFINGLGMVSAQRSMEPGFDFRDLVAPAPDGFHCIEPAYAEYFSPALARRFSRIIKMSLAAAKHCLKDAGIERPDAIITGTGLGCVEDTERFLVELLEHHEESLSPTPFIQSTHNTVGAQIAVSLGCTGYNTTFAHRGHSFEHALLDSMLFLNENTEAKVLLGGVDERTDGLITIRNNLRMQQRKHSIGADPAWGEGAAFFLVSRQATETTYAQIAGVSTLHAALADRDAAMLSITSLLDEGGVRPEDVGLILFGGDDVAAPGEAMFEMMESLFGHRRVVMYKKLSGEYCTASSFACWSAAMLLRHPHMVENLVHDAALRRPLNSILIYNPVPPADHAVMLLRRC